jgi:hypothetical protein
MPIAGFPTTLNPTLQVGFEPVFVDIELDTLNLDLDQVELALVSNPDIRVITFAHVLGNPPAMDRLMELVAKYDLLRDGDFAHTIRLKKPILGSNFISFPNKTIPKELGLDNYLDYDTMFNKDFKKPINDIMKLIGWSLIPPKKTKGFTL